MSTDGADDGIANAQAAVLDLKTKIAEAYAGRCSITEKECASLNYDACQSALRSVAVCDTDHALSDCEAADGECGTYRDYSTSVIRLPAAIADGENLNPTDPAVIESVCYTLSAQTDMRRAYEDQNAKTDLAVDSVYFGSWTGAFRYFPGVAQDVCGSYDPRLRPWYVAAASGPKDVVILIDTSLSMDKNNRLVIAKEATQTLIDTLSNNDYVGIVAFSTTAYVLGDRPQLMRASDEVKAVLKKEVDALQPDDDTNFEDAFSQAFGLLDSSREDGYTANCRTAIIMLTDGAITKGAYADELIPIINANNTDIDARVFTFALGSEADQITTKKIACETSGVFQYVPDNGDLLTSMASYWRYYATGLGGDSLTRTVWVQPYPFTTSGKLGTTVSTPIYDYTYDPPLFLGVVGMDFTLAALASAGTEDELLQQLIDKSSYCPAFDLTPCQRQAFRASVSSDSLCSETCENFPYVQPEPCLAADQYPEEVIINYDRTRSTWSYLNSTCCGRGSDYNASVPTCDFDIAVKRDNNDDDIGGGGGGGGGGGSGGIQPWGWALLAVAAVLTVGIAVLAKKKKACMSPGKANCYSTGKVTPPDLETD